ncbi:hypothetical protein LY625_03800 [Lysobacter sp. GX 14042]|uniref:hypothetical protein n=1 Tax=Lysobacter sp. GX 14042 TaxID=2907155 RepID=UPI001F1F0B5C|nr:hypothetical protein [Lysobacter sp. GX 14042]MCE7031748.1 hypothetical protein [Lysobacter sp. GX 14042]
MKLAVTLLVGFLVAVVMALLYRGDAIDARADLRAIESDLESVKVKLRTSETRRKTERARADRMYDIAAKAEQERIDAQETADRTIADLRAGTIRLREHWQGCPEPRLPGIDPSPAEPDAGARDREEGAGAIVSAAAECDAQVRGLQGVIREYLGNE